MNGLLSFEDGLRIPTPLHRVSTRIEDSRLKDGSKPFCGELESVLFVRTDWLLFDDNEYDEEAECA